VAQRKRLPQHRFFLQYLAVLAFVSTAAALSFLGWPGLASRLRAEHVAIALLVGAVAFASSSALGPRSGLASFAEYLRRRRPDHILIPQALHLLCCLSAPVVAGSVVGRSNMPAVPTRNLSLDLVLLTSLIATAYAGLIYWRRQPILELLQRGAGFLSYYEVYARNVARLYSSSGPPNRAYDLDGITLTWAAASLRTRFEWEQERMKREYEGLVVLVAIASAMLAAGSLFHWL
jgi:hypothetical protein